MKRTYELTEEDTKRLETNIDTYFVNNTKHTMTGLALALGFASRQSLYDYANKEDAHAYIIKRSILRIENSYELRLLGTTPTGAIFALKNMGWKDTPFVDQSTNRTLILQVEKATDAEIKATRKPVARI